MDLQHIKNLTNTKMLFLFCCASLLAYSMFTFSHYSKMIRFTSYHQQIRQKSSNTQRQRVKSPFFGDCHCGLIKQQADVEEKRLNMYKLKISQHKKFDTYTTEMPFQVQKEVEIELPQVEPCSLCHLKD